MADIQFYEADSDESSDSGDDGLLTTSEGYDSDSNNSDYGLSPLQKLEKHILSEHSYTRQVVARNLLETLKTIENAPEMERVLQSITKLASDLDSAVRTEVMEQIYAISVYVNETQFDHSFISVYILPPLVKCLQDCNAQVRKTSQASMLAIIQEGIISKVDVEAVVIPVLHELSEPDGLDDFRAEAIVMMTKLAPVLGAEITTRSFLNKFLHMCNDTLFHVRKVCATNFGDICSVVGTELTEAKLIPAFAILCEDDVWGVRNACTECFMQVSKACSMAVRRGELSRLFIGLLSDQSRWVRLAAFQSLGAFISTFADPLYTGLSLSEDGKIIHHPAKEVSDDVGSSNVSVVSKGQCLGDQPLTSSTVINDSKSTLEMSSMVERSAEDLGAEYTSFNYWRMPIFEVAQISNEVSTERLKQQETTESCEDVVCSHSNDTAHSYKLDDTSRNDESDKLKADDRNENAKDSHRSEGRREEVAIQKSEERFLNEKLEPTLGHLVDGNDQECFDSSMREDLQHFAIPPELLHHYLSMVDTGNGQTADAEIMKHCAFSFPAVAFALGGRNWYLLKSAYERLARDLQWKVRRTLSSSIHEMAIILGEELIMSDLLPIFDDFFKDLDEVRIGILRHLADFLRLLRHDVRRQYLPKISDFLTTDNSRNWRFRLDLTEQLVELLDLYSPTDICEYLTSVALTLADDKVAQVRYMSIHVLSKIIGKLSVDMCMQLWLDFVDCLKARFCQSANFGRRQLFAHLCSNLMETKNVNNECFIETFLPCLVTLSRDHVPNVRLAVAMCVFKHLVHDGYFMKSNHDLQDQFQEMISNLKKDSDTDVRSMLTTFASHLQTETEFAEISKHCDISETVPTSYLNEFITNYDEKSDLLSQTVDVQRADDTILTMEH